MCNVSTHTLLLLLYLKNSTYVYAYIYNYVRTSYFNPNTCLAKERKMLLVALKKDVFSLSITTQELKP